MLVHFLGRYLKVECIALRFGRHQLYRFPYDSSKPHSYLVSERGMPPRWLDG
jgi:hypothetical protein